ncbi:MAG: NAD-glutamate dehydrogenase [Gemmatimonadetes bacterium]|nr:NAD-glutamate dehydrogenase [Gemmatimonadota bacterium]MCY3943981.1 NAD-glutamate dehydrogenase [Gemmatimonadota bacterium]
MTEPGHARQAAADPPVVRKVLRHLRRAVDDDRYELLSAFAPRFLAKATKELLKERSTADLARMCVDSLDFLDRSSPDRVDVEVVNPEFDENRWSTPVTVVRTNISERPFIIDTIREFLSSQDLRIGHFVYPLFAVERDGDGRVARLLPSGERERTESLVHAEVARVEDEATRERLREEIAHRLRDVVRATDDFGLMLDKIGDVVSELGFRMRDVPYRRDELREVQAFLRWLRDGGFVFLGYRSYNVDRPSDETGSVALEPGSGLGVLRDDSSSSFATPVALSELPAETRELALSGPLLIISKTNAQSTVHRNARMDYIGVKKLDRDGAIAGEHRFLGLFTSQAYHESAQEIPILRLKLQKILERAGAGEGSHDYKEIITIFSSLPKEELFLASSDEIAQDIQTILTRYNTSDVFVSVRRDSLGRGVSIMAVMPRTRFSGAFRREFESVLTTRYQAEILNYHLSMGGGDQARLHFYLGGKAERLAAIQARDLESIVERLTRSWLDEVRERLIEVFPTEDAGRMARHYADAFAPEYQAATSPAAAVRDIVELEAMNAEGRRESVLFFDDTETGDKCDLKVYIRRRHMILSDFMPVLENCGLQVIAVSLFELREEDGEEDSSIYSFDIQTAEGDRVDVDAIGDVLAEAILAVRAGDAENDGFNRLVHSGGMRWREVEVLRAYAHYAFQIGAVPSRDVLRDALAEHPRIGVLLFALFEARFDPGGGPPGGERDARAGSIGDRIVEELVGVSSLAFDRALRALQAVLESTVRTNYYQTGGSSPTERSGGVPYLSLKFSSELLGRVTRSRLLCEVWVRSSRMEGIHLRGAPVARGGIRHSDRPDDFRTEVMDLALTQVVKNAVIVPGGSKGGFVCRRALPNPGEMAREVREQYCTLLRGVLDITDNLGGENAPPEGVVRYDGFDPYLVVAADKGTATFSDMANGVAAEYDFWLDDAFASGGSNGYDHKEVGITAMGAWEGVKRHFREMGRDIQSEPFTVVGIGDMSGDVFGNGMLLSHTTRLIAAFDHRHVMIDPTPDPEVSYRERERLFHMGRSSWEDYDRTALSAGGMIVSRGAKSVDLSPEARVALGLDLEIAALDGESLIRALLMAPVDLLWNGGIGTYVKAASESHADAGDTSNDAVRINAGQLRAKVVAEGGNLGLTQAGRVEYALLGGRINTDALDNSGGVSLSDREVNLKILLNEAIREGRLSREARNRLLERLNDTVAALVVDGSASGCKAISLDEYRARRGMDHYWALMGHLTRLGILDRDAEGLPSWDELALRRGANQSLTRPELAVLLAYAKLHLKEALLASDLPDDPSAEGYFLNYFPAGAVEAVGPELARRHRLRREIVACQLANQVLDLMGSAFIVRLGNESGRSAVEIARAWVVAAKVTHLESLLDAIGDREGEVSAAASYRWTMDLARVMDRTTRWILANADPEVSTTALIEGSLEGLAELRGQFQEIVVGREREDYEARVAALLPEAGSEGFVRDLASLRFLDHLLEILLLARSAGTSPVSAARVYYGVTELLRIRWLADCIEGATSDDKWEQRWALALVGDLGAIRRRLTEGILAQGAAADGIDVGGPQGRRRLQRFRRVVDEIEGDEQITLAGLSVAIQEIRRLALEAPRPALAVRG